jgi:glucose-1-phosphate cytidylyltransferase
MKAVILAGGYGTRLSEETGVRPKPMVEVGPRPILWHIMKIYAHYGVTDFIICCGYKGYVIKEYFYHYHLLNADITVDLSTRTTTFLNDSTEPWTVSLIDTGSGTLTGGRLKRVSHLLDDEPFFLTYGDGVANIDISASLAFHKEHGLQATMTAVQPPGRFGTFTLAQDSVVKRFREKPQGDDAWINGGFFVLNPAVIDYIDGDDTIWERDPLERLAREGQLAAYQHDGFWHPMDTLKDKNTLNDLWDGPDSAPWAVWSDSVEAPSPHKEDDSPSTPQRNDAPSTHALSYAADSAS